MDFVEAEQMYRDWCQQLQERHISATELTAWLDRLRVQDAQGQWWRIEHPGGVWLCWNGQAWERKNPPKEVTNSPDSPPTQASTQQTKEPQNLGQLIGWLAGSVLKGIPKQIVLGIFLIVIVWLLHLFLLVVVNDGFNLGSTNPWLASILVLGGKMIAGSLFWIFTGILLSHLVHGTLGQYLKAVTSFPPTVVSFCHQSSQFKAPILWLGFSGALGFALLFGNLLVSLQILLFTLVALQESTHFLRLVLKLGWQDAQKLIRNGKSPRPLTSDQCQQILSGIAVGCGVAAILIWLAPSLLRLFTIAVIAVTLWQFIAGKRPTTSPLSLFILFTLGSLTIGQMEPAWADDGGWAECGRSLETWIQCGGTDQAILNSGLAGLAIWLGWVLGGLPIPSASMPSSSVISTTPDATTLPQDIEYTYPDGRHTTLVYDPDKGGYINLLTGGRVAPDELNQWHQNNLDTYRRTEDWRNRNKELESTGQDAQSLALKAITDKYLQLEKDAQEKSNQQKKELIEMLIDIDLAESKREIEKGEVANSVMKVYEWIEWGADVSIEFCDNLATAGGAVSGPTTIIKYTYQGLKGLASGASETYHSDIPENEKTAWTYITNSGKKAAVNLVTTAGGDLIQAIPVKGWNPFAKITNGKHIVKIPNVLLFPKDQGTRIIIKYTNTGEALVNTVKSKVLDKFVITPVKDYFIPPPK